MCTVNSEELLPRCLKLLQGAIRASGMTQTEVDGRIGRRRGYLSHVFQRRVDLKVVDLLRTLQVLGISPSRFFESIPRASAPASAGVLQLLAERLAQEPAPAPQPLPAAAAPGPSSPEALQATVDPAEEALLEDRVRTVLQSILMQLGQKTRAHGG